MSSRRYSFVCILIILYSLGSLLILRPLSIFFYYYEIMKNIPRITIISTSASNYRLQLVLMLNANDAPLYKVLLNRKQLHCFRQYSDAVNYFVQRIQSHSLLINPVLQYNNLFFKDFNHG